ncbi:MAG TPA: hypothetical protein VMB21_21715 [Candidatus Limnocylindria bacterium]|nr:hypothetical protein [Candidatus Limnocylindria bacterium]
MKRLACGGILLIWAAVACAEDLDTVDGRVLRHVVFTEVGEDSVLVKHHDGSEHIYLFDLPPELQRRFHFDPVAALRRKTAEVERLKAELAAARGEVVSAKATAEKAVAQAQAQARSPAAAPDNNSLWLDRAPTRPAAHLPPLGKGETVNVFDLVNHYRTEPDAARGRYKGRDFVLEGIVERIEDRLVGRYVKVLCASPDRNIRVVIEWKVPDDCPKFYTKAEGRRLFGGTGRGQRILFEAGDRVKFAVRGGDFDDGAIHLGRSELVQRMRVSP